MNELLPCPFCGEAGEPTTEAGLGTIRHSIYCMTCMAEGPITYEAASAIAAWNRRAHLQARPLPVGEVTDEADWEEADELTLARAEVLSLVGLLAELDRMELENKDDALGGYCGSKVADFKCRYREAISRNGGVGMDKADAERQDNQWFGDMMILQVLADSDQVNDQEREVLMRWLEASQPPGASASPSSAALPVGEVDSAGVPSSSAEGGN